MLFLAKKIIGQLLMPIPLIACLFVIGSVVVRFPRCGRVGKYSKGLAIFLFLVFGYGVGAERYLYHLERTYPSVEGATNDLIRLQGATIVVLGQGIAEKSDLPLRYQTGAPFQMRLLEGVRLFRKIPDAQLLISLSGSCDDKIKQRFIDEYAQEHNLVRAHMRLITTARDTSDEARLAIDRVKTNRLVIVTSASHLPRAVKIFSKEFSRRHMPCAIISANKLCSMIQEGGKDQVIIPAPCDFSCIEKPAIGMQMWPLPLPSINAFNITQHALYEGLGNLYEDWTN